MNASGSLPPPSATEPSPVALGRWGQVLYRACDPKERAWFMNLPTTLVLAPQGADRLHEVAGRLLRQNTRSEQGQVLSFAFSAPVIR
jgi:hypothetical protein